MLKYAITVEFLLLIFVVMIPYTDSAVNCRAKN